MKTMSGPAGSPAYAGAAATANPSVAQAQASFRDGMSALRDSYASRGMQVDNGALLKETVALMREVNDISRDYASTGRDVSKDTLLQEGIARLDQRRGDDGTIDDLCGGCGGGMGCCGTSNDPLQQNDDYNHQEQQTTAAYAGIEDQTLDRATGWNGQETAVLKPQRDKTDDSTTAPYSSSGLNQIVQHDTQATISPSGNTDTGYGGSGAMKSDAQAYSSLRAPSGSETAVASYGATAEIDATLSAAYDSSSAAITSPQSSSPSAETTQPYGTTQQTASASTAVQGASLESIATTFSGTVSQPSSSAYNPPAQDAAASQYSSATAASTTPAQIRDTAVSLDNYVSTANDNTSMTGQFSSLVRESGRSADSILESYASAQPKTADTNTPLPVAVQESYRDSARTTGREVLDLAAASLERLTKEESKRYESSQQQHEEREQSSYHASYDAKQYTAANDNKPASIRETEEDEKRSTKAREATPSREEQKVSSREPDQQERQHSHPSRQQPKRSKRRAKEAGDIEKLADLIAKEQKLLKAAA